MMANRAPEEIEQLIQQVDKDHAGSSLRGELRTACIKQQGKIERLEDEIGDVMKVLGCHRAYIPMSIRDLKETDENHRVTINNLETDLTNAQNGQAQLRAEVASLQAENSALAKRLAAWEACEVSYKAENVRLRAKLQQASRAFTGLQEAYGYVQEHRLELIKKLGDA
jgi:peptidoglycan hydrolase CwlO-like protein